jgi:hypothetical protein
MILEAIKNELDSLVGNRVYLNVAPNINYPYIILDVSQTNIPCFSTVKKKKNTITIQVFTNDSSADPAISLIEQIESALNHKVLTETGRGYTALIPVSSETPKRTIIRNWRAQLIYKNFQS